MHTSAPSQARYIASWPAKSGTRRAHTRIQGDWPDAVAAPRVRPINTEIQAHRPIAEARLGKINHSFYIYIDRDS